MACVMTRRALLGLSGVAGVSLLRGGLRAAATPLPIENAVDHLLLGIADLDRGIEWVEEKTGLKAVIGGSHPGVGTRNALLSLGGRRYLEIIAPDPEQAVYRSNHDVRSLTEPRLIAWAAATKDVEAAAARARQDGHRLYGPRDGSRARPDGKLLKWKTLGVLNDLGRGGIEPIPFLIEWAADSVHPSEDSPAGCELLSLEIEHPGAGEVGNVLGTLGIQTTVKLARVARIVATLSTPRGEVRLS